MSACEHCGGPIDRGGDTTAEEMLWWALDRSGTWQGRYSALEREFNRVEEELIQVRHEKAALGAQLDEARRAATAAPRGGAGEIADLQNQIQELRREAEALATSLEERNTELRQARDEAQKAEDAARSLDLRLSHAERELAALKARPLPSPVNPAPATELRTIEAIKAAEWDAATVVRSVELHFDVAQVPAQLLHEKEGYFLRTTDGRRLTQFQDADGMATWLRSKKVKMAEVPRPPAAPPQANGTPGFDVRTPAELQEARKKAGLSQAQVAAALGVPKGTYAGWEYRGVIPENHRARLAAILAGAGAVEGAIA